ncbi:MAG: DUF3352 domain-containing protein, partial [Candidatus Sericytochromatia bacterium]
IQSVLPADSRFRLSNQAMFAPIRKSLEDKAVWLYLDTKSGVKAIEEVTGEEVPSEFAGVLDQLTTLYRGFGFGIDIENEGVTMKSFVAPDLQNLSPAQQDYLQAMQAVPEHELRSLFDDMPANPVLVTAGQRLDVALTKPLPVDLPLDDMPFSADDIRKGLKSLLNVDYKEDFLPAIDGRFGFGLFEPSKTGGTPQMVVYLGVKQGKEAAFDQMMQQQLRFNPAALDALGEEKQSQVQSNMKQLSSMLAIYAVDHEGAFPADLKALLADASQEDKAYWQDMTNPVSGKSGYGEALRDYPGMGSRPDVGLAGTVFYEPMGEEDGHFSGYAVYGYDPNGMLYRISNESDAFETVLDVLPKAEPAAETPVTISPKQVDLWQGIPIFSLPLDLPKEDLPGEIQPVFARKGSVWMLAINPEALKAALGGSKPVKLEQMMGKTGTLDASWLFFMDLQSTARLLKGVLPQFMENETDLNEFMEAFKPWRSLFAAARTLPKGTEGHFVVDVDLDKVDFGKLAEMAAEIGTEDGEEDGEGDDSNASLRENMQKVQTMVETYAVDHGGIYPADIAELRQAATEQEYWLDLSNPFAEDGEALMDYSSFKPGEFGSGRVLYEPVKDQEGQITSYRLMASDADSELLSDEGEPVVISNQAEDSEAPPEAGGEDSGEEDRD